MIEIHFIAKIFLFFYLVHAAVIIHSGGTYSFPKRWCSHSCYSL